MKKSEKNKLIRKAYRCAGFMRFITMTVLAVFIAGLWFFVLSPQMKYDKAQAELDCGNWLLAENSFAEIAGYEDSAEKSRFACCIRLFSEGDLSRGGEIFSTLTQNSKADVTDVIGSFTSLAEAAVTAGDYKTAYSYYQLDSENPEAPVIINALDAYFEVDNEINRGNYSVARELVDIYSADGGIMKDELLKMKEKSYRLQFDFACSFETQNLQATIDALSLIADEYEPARTYIHDTENLYFGACEKLDSGKYSDALAMFETIKTYSDSAYMCDVCSVLLLNENLQYDPASCAAQIMLYENWKELADWLPADSAVISCLAENGYEPAVNEETAEEL